MRKFVKRKSKPDWESLMSMCSNNMSNGSYRNMLDNVHPGCYVEAESTMQGGTVVGVIRDKSGVPACFKVKYVRGVGDDYVDGDEDCAEIEGFDYIPVDRITFYEPFSYCVPDDEYNWELEEMHVKWLLEQGYHWDDDRCCYYNNETGDEIAW